MRKHAIHLLDRSTDGPFWGSVWFVCGSDRPMVLYSSSVGPINRWSCFICKPSQPWAMDWRIAHCRWPDGAYSTQAPPPALKREGLQRLHCRWLDGAYNIVVYDPHVFLFISDCYYIYLTINNINININYKFFKRLQIYLAKYLV